MKNLTISDEKTIFNTSAIYAGADSFSGLYSDVRTGALHKKSEIFINEEPDITQSLSDDVSDAYGLATTDYGYIEPYKYAQDSKDDGVKTIKDSGYLRYYPDAAIEGSKTTTYFWIEDFKNWATWMISPNSTYTSVPAANDFVLCLWNGRDGFKALDYNGAMSSKDQVFQKLQNDILARLRLTSVDINGVPSTIDEFISHTRGDFQDFNNSPWGNSMPAIMSRVYVLNKITNYSIYDSNTMQTFRYGNPLNLDITEKASVSTIIKTLKNFYFDEAAIKRYTGQTLAEYERSLWGGTHYNENRDTGGEEASDYIAPIAAGILVSGLMASPIIGGIVGGITRWFSSEKGNANWFYKYRSGKHVYTDRADMELIYDPNTNETISWKTLEARYFSSCYYYGLPVQPYTLSSDGFPTSSDVYIELRSPEQSGRCIQVFYRNGHLKCQNASTSENSGTYNFSIDGEANLRHGLFTGAVDLTENITDRFGKNMYNQKLGEYYHASSTNFFNVGSVGLPPLYRLPTGELAINTIMRIGGTRGICGYDADFLNKKCQKLFGDGLNKTINDDWLKEPTINSNEENNTAIKKLSDGTLDSTKLAQVNNVVVNDSSIGFTANNVVLTTSDLTSNDYVAKW